MERTINNGVHLNRLIKQFRMRPEIMSLVIPFITDQLEMSEHLTNLPNVIGITKNVFFINHDIIEVNNNSNFLYYYLRLRESIIYFNLLKLY